MKKRHAEGDPLRVVGYVRVSTDDQALSPVGQRKALSEWCERHGCELVRVYEDLGVSGGAELEARPGLMALFDGLLELRAGRILVVKRDRLARDVMLAGMFERLATRAGATLVSADGAGNGDGPEAQLMRGIVDVFAQYERALIRYRTKSALAVKKARGERVGAVPLGKRAIADGVLEDCPSELGAIYRVVELKRLGLSIRAIAARLNTEGVPARGARWHRTTVHRLLSSAT